MDTSLIINSQDTSGNKLQKTITCVNPAAQNSDLKTFAQMATGLTTNDFVTANRVNRMNVDEPGGGSVIKTEPTLALGNFSYDGYNYSASITYDGDGSLSANSTTALAYCKVDSGDLIVKSNSSTFTGTLFASEGESFAAKSIAFSKT